jgi:hypothetical protein
VPLGKEEVSVASQLIWPEIDAICPVQMTGAVLWRFLNKLDKTSPSNQKEIAPALVST